MIKFSNPRTILNRLLTPVLIACAIAACPAQAFEAGMRQLKLPATGGQEPVPVALYYPSATPARSIQMGPFEVNAALYAPAAEKFKALIVLSHGLGGSELGHSSLAEALARSGYLVAAIRHPGDNWQDRSLIESSHEKYFQTRPLALSQTIDAILAQPEWANRIARDEKGPLIGALGHSAGGFSVLALAGGQADTRLVQAHCAARNAQDPVFCGIGRKQGNTQGNTLPAMPAATGAAQSSETAISRADQRVRAVVAMAPVGVPFTTASLSSIKIPTLIYAAAMDRFLVPEFHARRIARETAAAELRVASNAWHFAFLDMPSMSIPSPDGDLQANPPGFDRSAFLKQLAQEIPAWFDKNLR